MLASFQLEGGSRGGRGGRGGRGRGGGGGGWNGAGFRGGRGRGDGGEGSSQGSGRGRGRGRGGVTDEQKMAIVSAQRPKTLQIAGESTDDIIVAAKADERVQHMAGFLLKKDEFEGFNSQRQIRIFINSCLLNLSNHHSVDTSGLLTDLSSSNGIARLTEIMEKPMTVDAGDSRDQVSFQYIGLPLIGILTREKVCMTTMTSKSGLLYAAVYLRWRSFLLDKVMLCMSELIRRQSLDDHHRTAHTVVQDPSVCRVSTLQGALLGIVRLVYQLIKRQQDARVEIAPLIESIHEEAARCIKIPTTSTEAQFLNRILAMEVDRLKKMVGDAHSSLLETIDGVASPGAVRQVSRGGNRTKGPNMVSLNMNYDPPGLLSKLGPRHDNDFAEISQISILPTQEETTCIRPPFLPSNDVPNAPHFLEPGWPRQLDIHFRLYREDMMDALRKGIMAFFSALEKTERGHEERLLNRKELRKHMDDNVSLNVYGNVTFHGMNCTQKQGGSIKISFAQPPQILGVKKDKRRLFWERSKKRLMQGSLVGVTSRVGTDPTNTDDSIGPNFRMIFGVVTSRDIDEMTKDEDVAHIQISLTDPNLYLMMLNTATLDGQHDKWFLVESTGAFFESYRPVLNALKTVDPATLPFGKYFAPTAHEKNEILNYGNKIDPPLYARTPGFSFDLSVILKDYPFRLDVSKEGSAAQAVNVVRSMSTLDDTQATALVETLCREVALISGPPGTGKTRIGVDLMQVLLHNKDAMNCGPIVCICYTNHALDQFLEHLLDKDVTDIVRIGSRSKAERLEPYNLESLMRSKEKPFSVRQALRDVHEEWDIVSRKVERLEKALRSDYLDWEYVGPILLINNPDMWDEFDQAQDYDLDDSDEGFERVERKKYQNPYERWATGGDIREKENWNQTQAEAARNPKSTQESGYNPYNYLLEDDESEEIEQPYFYSIPSTNRPLALLRYNVWAMSRAERQRLLDSWRTEVQASMMGLMRSLLKDVENIGKKKNDAFDAVRQNILKGVSVIGMTTNGAAKCHALIEAVAPKIIICEEAGEVLESHILATLSASTQHLILIGDHKQLRPSIETYNLSSDSFIGKQHNLDRSLFERLVIAEEPFPSSELTIQRRMRPEISNLIRTALYPNLVDGDTVLAYPHVAGMGESLYFMDHAHPEDMKDQYGMQSYSNTFEVNMVEALAHYLIKNGYDKPGDIAILTPYLGQLSKMRDCLKNSFTLVIDERDQEQLDQSELDNEEKNELKGNKVVGPVTHVGVKNVALQKHLTLRTIDNYQGEEAKIVIITLVRSNVNSGGSSSSGSIGFLKSPNRTNVLLSRAQHGMFIVGNADLMDNPKNGIWPCVIKELRTHDRVGMGLPIYCKNHPDTQNIVNTPDMLKQVAPNGGCTRACNRGMPCGHACPLSCHPNDPEHISVKCYEPCPRLHQPCGHACPKVCGDSCGLCMEIVKPMALACDHIFEKPRCWQKQNPSKIICAVRVLKKTPTCEHEHIMECYKDPTTFECRERCGVLLECGHPCMRSCHQCQLSSQEDPATKPSTLVPRTKHGKCTTRCDRTQFCGHSCAANCHTDATCPPCKNVCVSACAHYKCHLTCNDPCAACCGRCEWECPHEGRCNMPCGAPCDRLPCNKRCEKILPCEHRCPSVCGEVCPSEKFCVECKNPDVMDMMVDMIMQATLAEVDVDEDPIMALSCGHAATMSTLDGMMEMNTYYQEQVDKKTGDVTYISKKDLPGKEVPQVSCHLCRQPIVTLLRYGRRIKYGQLSMRMKKHQVAQAKAMRDAQEEFDVNRILVQDGQAKFLQSLSISEMESCRDPPAEKTRRLGRYKDSSQKFPGVNFLLITTVYNIPREHEKAWAEFLGPLSKSLKKVTAIYNVAMRSPTKQLFDAAVSHLYRLKTAPTMGLPGATEEPVMADDVIRACILECGLPSDGHGGSSYVDSLQEKTNILLFVLAQAFVALDDTGISSGWYWFVEDLIQCCYVHTCILIEAAKNGKYPRKETHARLHRLDLIVKRVRWIGQRAVPEDDAAMEARLDRVNEDNEFFLKEIGEIVRNCPLGISEMCAERVTALQDTMQDVVKVARSATFYQSVSRAEKFEVFRVMSDQLGGSGHWYQCPNGHTYVIADCGMAMTQSECPECGESIGGGHHALLRSNRLDQEFEEMYRQRR